MRTLWRMAIRGGATMNNNYTLWESDFNNTEDWETVCKAFKLPNNTTCIDIKVSSLITAERNAIVFNKEQD